MGAWFRKQVGSRLRTHATRKGPGGAEGQSLGSAWPEGPQSASSLSGWRTRPRTPAGFRWGKLGTSPLILPSWRVPPHLPLLFLPPALPPTPLGLTRLERALEGSGPAFGASRLPGAQVGRGNTSYTSPDPPVLEGPFHPSLFLFPPPPSLPRP